MPKRQRSGTGRPSARPQKQQQLEQQQEQNQHRALAIPEIILLIGEHLDKKPRVACLRINRIFHQTLLSQLWKSTILSEEPIGPDYPELENHSTLVKELTITGTFTSNPMSRILSRLQCENLSVLTVTHRQVKQKPMATMIERHRDTLQAVHYTIYNDVILSEDLLKALPSCGRLKELSIKPLILETPNQFLDQYVRLWSRLKILTLGEVRFLGPEEGKKKRDKRTLSRWAAIHPSQSLAVAATIVQLRELGPLSGMQDISLYEGQETMIVELLAAMIRKCPDLVRLRWDVHERSYPILQEPMAVLTSVTATTIMSTSSNTSGHSGDAGPDQSSFYSPRALESLSMINTQFRGQDLDRLLKNTRSQTLRNLDFRRTPFDLSCWTVLKSVRSLPRAHVAIPDAHLQITVFQQPPQVLEEPLATGLTSLILKKCQLVTSLMVQDMLCTMPKLQTFAADFIFGCDIVQDDRAWVCNGLERLALPFIMNPPPDLDEEEAERARRRNQDVILTRLSQLERLEILDLDIASPGFINWKTNKPLSAGDALGLELTLDHGLDQLRSLRRILFIRDVFNSRTIWGPAEVEWCSTHWKRMLLSPGGTKGKQKMSEVIYQSWWYVNF